MRSNPPSPWLVASALLVLPVLPGCDEARAETGNEERATRQCAEPDESDQPAALATGLVGVAPGQQANLHLTRLHPPDPGEPIALIVDLVDAQGDILVEHEIVLDAGASETITLNGPDGGERTLFRAAVFVPPPDDGVEGGNPPDDGVEGVNPPDDGLDSGGIQATLEIVDVESLRTQLMVNPIVVKGFNPQPEPPA